MYSVRKIWQAEYKYNLKFWIKRACKIEGENVKCGILQGGHSTGITESSWA